MRFRDWWYQKKSQFYASEWVQDISARLPLLSRISRKEGEAIFQLMSGFVDTQILLAFVRTGALDKLRDRPKSLLNWHRSSGLMPRLRGFCVVLGRRLALSLFERIRFQSHVAEF